ncbi:MAG: single-stranded DNA-binding protein, partial [Candidatus Methanomethylophilaceae archaeon]|nr:single-stranded DNA-binding protein [Candidatus Methanomethylophilaceae archaeon]
MEYEQLTPIVEELTKVLEGKASREDIEQQVSTYANVYKIEDTRRIRDAILKKYGMGPATDVSFVTADHVQKKIADLLGNENRVDILARIVFVEQRTATIKGVQRKLVSGIL